MKNFIDKIIKYQAYVICLLVTITISFMTVGYAKYGKLLSINGFVTIESYVTNTIKITNISYVSGTNITSHNEPSMNELTATFPRNVFNVNTNRQGTAIYTVEITNDTPDSYIYESEIFVPNASGGAGWFQSNNFSVDIVGIQPGDEIIPGETKLITITFTATSSSSTTITASPTITFDFSSDNTGSLLASLSTTSVNLRNSTSASVQFSLINTYPYARNFELLSSNSNFSFTDVNGNPLTNLSVPNGTHSYMVYIKRDQNASFLSDTVSTNLIVSSNGLANITAGTIEVLVNEDLLATDNITPQIGEVTISQATTNGKINVAWSRLDVGGTNVTNYTIIVYNSSGNVMDTINTGNGLVTYTTNNSNQTLSAGSYYVIVYGTDAAGNTGSSCVSTATTSTTDCRKSQTVSMQWIYDVDSSNVSNLTFTGAGTVTKGANYMASLSANNGSLPSSITITMGGTNLTTNSNQSSYYTYSSSNGNIVIYNVQGDLVISATGSCLVKGTLITLANGSTKKIEDVNYKDLLLVWDYEHGEFTYEYPIWIEKEGKSDFYQLTTFSDGSTLKTVNYHGIFSLDKMQFVNIDNREDFHVGTRVIKISNDNNKLEEVSVSKIEIIEEKVTYYQVVTSTYYNVISDNYLTTDGNVALVNLYGFNSDITWKEKRQEVIKSDNNLFKYEEIKEALPYYMFVGLRAAEVKYIANLGYFKLEELPSYIKKLQNINNKLLLPVETDNNNNRLWMVTTSDDIINNVNDYLYKEGSYYVLKTPKNVDKFVGWYNTTNSTIYNPGDKVEIWIGTHFKAIYNN